MGNLQAIGRIPPSTVSGFRWCLEGDYGKVLYHGHRPLGGVNFDTRAADAGEPWSGHLYFGRWDQAWCESEAAAVSFVETALCAYLDRQQASAAIA
jgi:hypothetical protein